MSIDERFNSDLSQLEELKDKNDYKPFYGQIIEQEVGRRSTLHKELRSYEVSLWTLQDEFITVLKWSDVEQQDRIRDPQMKLNVDGTQTLTFSIPMYLYVEVPDSVSEHIVRIEKRENPIWYNTQNGNLMVGLRKIKVIFNKYDKSSEQVFEFLITKVTESHEQDQLTCNIECEGLAFHELGKIGYKISLSQDTYTLDKKDYDETGTWTKYDGTLDDNEPIENVQYWAEHCGLVPWPLNGYVNPTVWYYTIEMNWGSFSGGRASNKVYDDEYISSWTEQSGALIANDVHAAQERARPISVSESNIYNITQTIAETFKIYCCYEYGYDDNYHINSRKVVFYNNYLNENNVVSFTYPYATKSITREMDSTDVVTKMYVRPQDDTSVVSGKINIDTCPANKSKEDYLLNFDYLYANKLINKEQYDEIAEYERKMRQFNTTLDDLSLRLAAYEDELTTQKAKVTLYSNAKDLDQEQIDYNSALYNKLTAEGNGYIRRTATNPYSTYIKKDKKGQYYIKLSDEDKGIDPTANNILIFRVYNSAKQTFKNRITNFTVITDTDGVNKFASKIILSPFQESFNIDRQQKTVNLKDPIEGNEANIWDIGNGDLDDPMNDNSSTSLLVYLVYQYKPILYYEEINKVWLSKQAEDEKNYLAALKAVGPESINDENFDFETVFNDYVATSTMSFSTNDYNELHDLELSGFKSVVYNAGIHSKIKIVENSITENLTAKKATINKFNAMMGPALREGFWQPDSYNDYGDKKNITTTLKFSGVGDNSNLNDTNDFILPGKITDNNMKIGWDATLFDGEDKTYYEYGITKDHLYYPCIVLKDLNLLKTIRRWLKNSRRPSLVFNNNYYKTLNNSDEINDRQNMEVFTLGGGLEFGYVCKKPNNEHRYVYPALIVTGAKDMTDDEIVFMMTRADQKGNPRLALVETKINSNGTPVTKFIPDNGNNNYGIALNASDFYWYTGKYPDVEIKPHSNNDFNIVYPSLKCSSTELNTNSIIIKYNDILLSNYIDYQILSRSQNQESNDPPIKRSYFEYIIRINPETVMKFSAFPQEAQTIYEQNFEVKYVVSNASTAIYLDALEVMLESSKPKVSYTVDVNVLDQRYLSTLYKDLAQLVMINDNELKFQNTFGYISGLELNLDKPQEDKIEVKNYKTKFEDLFSTIVAQTEEMKKNGELLGAIANGQVPLGEAALQTTIDSNWSIFQEYLNSGFDSSEVVKNKLTEIFTEASMILNASQQSLQAIRDLNIKNAEILAGFVENIAADLTPNIVTSQTQPTDFKVGDVWNQVDANGNIIGRYVATSNSEGAAGGYTRTFDGSLASITGASLNVDAVAGTIELLAQNRIDMKSGGNIYIAANENIDMVGNNQVNIGGGEVNICAMHTVNEDGTQGSLVTPKGINLINAEYNTANLNNGNIAKVLISPKKIEMGAAELVLKASSTINLIASTGQPSNTSAISIDADHGVWIGSGAGVRLFSGNVSINNNGTINVTSGANIELNSEHLILGFSTTDTAQAIEMKNDYLVIASGNIINSTDSNVLNKINTGVTGTSTGLVGAKFTKNSIGLATGSNNNINAILMNDDGITIGSGSIDVTQSQNTLRAATGSYVRIAGDGIDIGSLANLYINANNFKLQTDTYNNNGKKSSLENTIFAMGKDLNSVDADTAYDSNTKTLRKKNSSNNTYTDLITTPTVDLLLNKNGLYVRGIIYASGGSFTGNVVADTFIAQSSRGYFIANGNKFGLYETNSTTGILTIDNNGAITANGNLSISSGKTLSLDSANLRVDINTNNYRFYINTAKLADPSETPRGAFMMYYGSSWSSATQGIRFTTYNENNNVPGLEIKGAVTATSFALSGDNAMTDFSNAVNGVIDVNDFKVNGIGWTTWNGGHYVSLTSTADNSDVNGILIGVSQSANVTQHIIVPYAANNTRTVVDISREGIYFDHFSSAPDANTTATNYIHMDIDGIEVKGNRIKINGDDVWARDDIIIMNNGLLPPADDAWRRSVESIEAYMKNGSVRLNSSGAIVSSGGTKYTRSSGASEGDWVLIKPYYDAKFEFSWSGPTSIYGNNLLANMNSNSANPYFGTTTGYTYVLKCTIYMPDPTNQKIKIFLYAQRNNGTKIEYNPTYTLLGGTVGGTEKSLGSGNDAPYIDSNDFIHVKNTSIQTITLSLPATNDYNLCQEGYAIYTEIAAAGGTSSGAVTVHNLHLQCTCDKATGKVPCTVYYYP